MICIKDYIKYRRLHYVNTVLQKCSKDTKAARKFRKKIERDAYKEIFNLITEDTLDRDIITFLSTRDDLPDMYSDIEWLSIPKIFEHNPTHVYPTYFGKKLKACWLYAHMLALYNDEFTHEDKVRFIFKRLREYLWLTALVDEDKRSADLVLLQYMTHKNRRKKEKQTLKDTAKSKKTTKKVVQEKIKAIKKGESVALSENSRYESRKVSKFLSNPKKESDM